MGKSSSQVVGYRYYAKFAAFIGNRIEKLIAINFDNRKWVVHDPLKHPPNLLPVLEGNLFGENEGGVSGNVDIHFGYPDPEPNAEYQKYFPLVSGYPYQSYLVFRGLNVGETLSTSPYGFYLGNSGYMKEMLLWVKRIHVKNDGSGQWYDAKSEVPDMVALSKLPAGEYNPNWVFNHYPLRISVDSPLQESMSEIIIARDFGTPAASLITFNLGNWGGHKSVDASAALEINCDDQLVSAEFSLLDGASEFDDFDVSGFYADKTTSYRDTYKVISGLLIGVSQIRINFSIKRKGESSQVANAFVGVKLQSKNPDETLLQSGDINPIHKIREVLTDDTAMGKPESDVNDENFMKAADRIYYEGLGVSWAIDEKSCIEAIEELCYHIEAGIRVNRQTGLYEMVLFRDDWFVEDEIHNISESRIKDLSLEVMNSDDIVNQLNVTYYDRERIKNSTFSVYENGSILTMGHANAESVDFPYFMHMRNAEIVANWKLKQFSTPAWSGSFTTGWKEARKWNRYDLIHLPWSKKWNGTILVRIMKINLGDGVNNTVTIDFEEVIPYSREMNTSIVVDAPVDSAPQPPQPSMNAVFEAPYYLTVLRAGQTNTDLELSNNPDIGYVAAIAAKPQSNSINALLYTDGGIGEFEQVSRLDYCDILQLDQPINETMSAFVVTGSLTQTANLNNFILLNDELMGFVSFDDATKVLTVKRGVLDTVPKKHSRGSLFVFDLPDVAFDSTQYSYGEIVEAQVLTTTPSGIQALSAGTAIEIQSRAIRPYPPANVKINSEYWPEDIETDLILTWVDRNRVQQTGGSILSWFDASVLIESGTTTHLTLTQYDENQIELATSNANLTGATSYTMPISTMQANTRFVKITLKTVRDGYECLIPFIHTVELSQFFSAPYDLVVEYKNDQ